MKLTPPTSAFTSGDNSFQNGALVMYENDGSPLIGAVLGFKNKKFQVLNMRGREVELQSIRMHPLGATLPADASTLAKKSEFLSGLYEKAHKKSIELNLEEIWSLVREEAESLTSTRIGELYFGKATFEDQLTLRLALIADRIFFKRKGDEFFPRSVETVEDLKRSEEAAAKKQRIHEAALSFLLGRLKDRTIPIPAEVKPIITLLEDIAAGTNEVEHNRQKEIKELMNVFCERARLDLPPVKEHRAFAILEDVGIFDADTNLAIVRYRPPIEFTQAALQEADRITQPSSSHHKDRTDLWCATIDDISTLDMDDALSVEETSSGYTLGVHISDVASVIPPNSILDREARTRTTSLYLAGNPVNMLPEILSEDVCSLVRNKERLALSCFFEFDRTFALKGARMEPTKIKTTERLDYEHVTRALESDNGKLLILYQIAMAEEQRRIESGAHKVTKKEVLFNPQKDGSIKLTEIDEADPARSMVGELMILANSYMADFARKNSIPVAYRGQEKPDREAPLPEIPPPGPAADFAERGKMKKSVVDLEPMSHFGLGLESYIQATSPIRRYVDLCNQRQLLSFLLHGKPIYTKEMFAKILEEIDQPLGRAGQVSKETRRFWMLKYLQQMHDKGERISGTIVRRGDRTPLVELDKLYVTVFAKVTPERKLGDHVELQIEAIDPRSDYLRLIEKIK